jgi:polyphenol oxidase
MDQVCGAETHRFDDMLQFVFSPALADLPWLRHGSTTRDFSHPHANRLEELIQFRRTLGLSDDVSIVRGDQRHTDNVEIATDTVVSSARETGQHVFPATDAVVTAEPNVMIAILTADCAPVLLVDPRKRIIGVTHAGWRGSFDRIAEKTVSRMRELGAVPDDIVAWVGPMIGGCCYEVSEELAGQFQDEFGSLAEPGKPFANGRLLDLPELNAAQLVKMGLRRDHVHRSGLCTMHLRDQFYSYRGDQGTTGRIISAMAITG